MYTQHERGTTIPVSVGQDPAVITYRYKVEGAGGGYMWKRSETDTKNRNITGYRITLLNGSEVSRMSLSWNAYLEGANRNKFDLSYSNSTVSVNPIQENFTGVSFSAMVVFDVIDSGAHRVDDKIQLNQSAYQ